MNKCIFAFFATALFVSAFSAMAQDDKPKRASPSAAATAEVGETQITIDYSQPSVK